jgi:hypothetical protein
MALVPDRHAEVFPVILELADKYGLVCFDAQNTIVHLPSTPILERAKSASNAWA